MHPLNRHLARVVLQKEISHLVECHIFVIVLVVPKHVLNDILDLVLVFLEDSLEQMDDLVLLGKVVLVLVVFADHIVHPFSEFKCQALGRKLEWLTRFDVRSQLLGRNLRS